LRESTTPEVSSTLRLMRNTQWVFRVKRKVDRTINNTSTRHSLSLEGSCELWLTAQIISTHSLAIVAHNDWGDRYIRLQRHLPHWGARGVRRSISYPGGSFIMQVPPGYEESVKRQRASRNHCTVCTPQISRVEVVRHTFLHRA
jgi:hypothetical protein